MADLIVLSIVSAAVALALGAVYAPWAALDLPARYAGDDLVQAMWAKNIAQGGDYARSDLLGAPYGQVLHDFPQGADRLTLLMLDGLTRLGIDDPFRLVNTVYVLDFFVIAWVTYAVVRSLGTSRMAAGLAALVFTFLPYHFAHGTAHLFLSAYVAVPLLVLLAVWTAQERLAPPVPTLADGRPRRSGRRLVVIGAVLVVGWSGPYYAAFAVLLIAGAAAVVALATASWRPAIGALAVVSGITLASAVALAPDLAWIAAHGNNEVAIRRHSVESDVYGLRLAQLVLPGPDHRVEPLARLGSSARRTGVGNENNGSLGLAAVVGLAFVAVVAIRLAAGRGTGPPERPVPARTVATAGLVAALAFLGGTVGGLGFLISVLGFTPLRVWGRLTVVIGFVGVCGLAWAVDAAVSRTGTRAHRRALVAVALVATLAILDQTPADRPRWRETEALLASERSFVRAMEGVLPVGSMVFQLPVVDFPESPPVGGLQPYDSLRPFLLGGDRLRWSHGGIKGRQAEWQRWWSQTPPPLFVRGLSAAGFSALLVDRRGDGAAGAPGWDSVRQVLGDPVATSGDGRLGWFDLRPLGAALEGELGSATVRAAARAVLRPLRIRLRSGIHAAGPDESWMGASAVVEAVDANEGAEPVRLSLVARGPEGSNLVVETPTGRQVVALHDDGVPVELDFGLPGGVGTIHLHTDAPRQGDPDDERDLRIRLARLRIGDPGALVLEGSPSPALN